MIGNWFLFNGKHGNTDGLFKGPRPLGNLCPRKRQGNNSVNMCEQFLDEQIIYIYMIYIYV